LAFMMTTDRRRAVEVETERWYEILVIVAIVLIVLGFAIFQLNNLVGMLIEVFGGVAMLFAVLILKTYFERSDE